MPPAESPALRAVTTALPSGLPRELGLGGAAGAPDPLLSLAREAAKGNPDAVRTLVMEVAGPMLRTVRRVLGANHPDAEDVTQDAVLALLDRLQDFRGECSIQYYANRIALLRGLSARKRFAARPTDGTFDLDELAETDRPGPEAALQSSRRRTMVLGLLERLPDNMAEAMALHFVLGHTVEEIAAMTTVPSNTVWSRLRLGKQALRRALAHDDRLVDMLSEEGES